MVEYKIIKLNDIKNNVEIITIEVEDISFAYQTLNEINESIDNTERVFLLTIVQFEKLIEMLKIKVLKW